jgi:hypothetical protein
MELHEMQYVAELIERGAPEAFRVASLSLGEETATALYAGHLIFDEDKPSNARPAPGMEAYPEVIRVMRRFGIAAAYQKALAKGVARSAALALTVAYLRHEARCFGKDAAPYVRRSLMLAGLTVQFSLN